MMSDKGLVHISRKMTSCSTRGTGIIGNLFGKRSGSIIHTVHTPTSPTCALQMVYQPKYIKLCFYEHAQDKMFMIFKDCAPEW